MQNNTCYNSFGQADNDAGIVFTIPANRSSDADPTVFHSIFEAACQVPRLNRHGDFRRGLE